MRLSWVSLIGAFVALALVSSARGESKITPKGDQSAAQLQKDKDDCRRWAAQHTGFDPKHATPSEPPRQTTPGLKSVPGVKEDPQLKKARQRDELIERKRQKGVHKANIETRRANYDRAVKTCLEGRNYSVN